MSRPFLLAVMGPTASGKTELAEALADRFEAQLINADAFQIYRGFDIGTAKTDNKGRYLFIDIREPGDAFGVGEFVILAANALAKLWDARKNAIVVGGTGLYIRALFEQYRDMSALPDPALRAELDARIRTEGLSSLSEQLRSLAPDLASQIDLSNPARVRRGLEKALSRPAPIRFELPSYARLKVAIERPIDELDVRIGNRLEGMLHNGWVEEVARLRAAEVYATAPAMRGIGYSTIWRHLDSALSLEDARIAIFGEMRRYARRQQTWLRREPSLISLRQEQGPLADQASRLIEGL